MVRPGAASRSPTDPRYTTQMMLLDHRYNVPFESLSHVLKYWTIMKMFWYAAIKISMLQQRYRGPPYCSSHLLALFERPLYTSGVLIMHYDLFHPHHECLFAPDFIATRFFDFDGRPQSIPDPDEVGSRRIPYVTGHSQHKMKLNAVNA